MVQIRFLTRQIEHDGEDGDDDGVLFPKRVIRLGHVDKPDSHFA
jgi:hypothetical protein